MKIPFLKTHASRGFALCAGAAFFVLVLFVMGALDALELKSMDFRFSWRGSRAVDSSLVVVAIDERSMEKMGRWPWPRKVHGELIQFLDEAGVQTIVFDTLFTESDRQDPSSDRAFIRAVQKSEHVALAFFFDEINAGLHGGRAALPIEPLSQDAHIGFANYIPDSDGVLRRALVYLIDGNNVYPSLAVAAYALNRNLTLEEVLAGLPIHVDADPLFADNTLFVNFAFHRGETGDYAYPTYSYAEVLEKKISPEIFKDKVVLIGATAAGLGDMKPIPGVPLLPGVMIHANVLDNLLHNNYLRETPTYLTALYVVFIGVLFGLLLPRLSTWQKLGVFLAVVGGGVGAAHALFAYSNYVIHMVPPFLAGVGAYGLLLFYQVVIEEGEKRKIKGSFKQYLSPKIIDVITRDPSQLKLGGEEREVSIFFLDIAGFTTMSEALKPTQLVVVMNECLTRFSDVILKHDGLINKYIGDCIMAFWNAPAEQPRHAAQACLAALDCIQALPDINRSFQAKGLPSIDCRIGINTGTVVVGNMGSKEKFDYTVMGDAVNLASRLEGANKQYHTRIMISDVTFEKARDAVEARDLDLIRVKGKKEPRKVFELLCRKGEMSDQLENGRHHYHEGLRHYRQRAFSESIAQFKQVFDYLPGDSLTKVYLSRAELFLKTPPPPDWDGSFEMQTK